MRKFTVKRNNIGDFVSRMRQLKPIEFKHYTSRTPNDVDSDGVKEITFMSDKEHKQFMESTKCLYVTGKKYRVIGGSHESDSLGFAWYFVKGTIIECTGMLGTNKATYRGKTNHFGSFSENDSQKMEIDKLHLLIEAI